jgi:hypothetical protein
MALNGGRAFQGQRSHIPAVRCDARAGLDAF